MCVSFFAPLSGIHQETLLGWWGETYEKSWMVGDLSGRMQRTIFIAFNSAIRTSLFCGVSGALNVALGALTSFGGLDFSSSGFAGREGASSDIGACGTVAAVSDVSRCEAIAVAEGAVLGRFSSLSFDRGFVSVFSKGAGA